MEFTNDLKKKLEGAQNKEEAQAIIDETKKGAEEAGIILSDDDLDQAAGGASFDKGGGSPWSFR
jgi:hypothetical protein